MTASEFTEIANFALETEAGQLKSVLEENGIPAFIDGANANTMLSYVGTALGGVKLLIRTADVERATEILGLHNNEPQSNEPLQGWFCGSCEEDVDAGFQVCWSCGEERSRVEAVRPERTGEEEPGRESDGAYAADEEAEKMLRRAWRASVIGIVFFPVITHLYSMYLLVRASSNGGQFSSQGQKTFYVTLALNVFAGCIWSSLLRTAIW